MGRDYQHGFSDKSTAMFNISQRQRKAKTMVAVLRDYIGQDLNQFTVLNVGGSSGIIDDYLSGYFGKVIGIDIDEKAISYAKENFKKDNLVFEVGDAMDIHYDSNVFDFVICSQVYEHVPSAEIMMDEIFRVLKPGGVCYFAAGNRLMLNDPHYNLPLLSVMPRYLAHIYLRAARKGTYYYEKHLSYWGLKKLVNHFEMTDYTKAIILSPENFNAEYMIRPNTIKHQIALLLAKHCMWLVPGYIWLLKKPNKQSKRG